MSEQEKAALDNEKPAAPSGDSRVTDRQTYNMVSDTVVGANFRMKDNVFQAIAIFVCLCVGAITGAIAVEERMMGALVGGFVGVLVGLFGSGIFLMVYRAIMHMRGKHDQTRQLRVQPGLFYMTGRIPIFRFVGWAEDLKTRCVAL